MPQDEVTAAARGLFDAALAHSIETGIPLRDAVIEVAAQPRHYVLHARVPPASRLTPGMRRRFFYLRRELVRDRAMPAETKDAYVLEADSLLARWEFGVRDPGPTARESIRRTRLRAMQLNSGNSKPTIAYPKGHGGLAGYGSGPYALLMHGSLGLAVVAFTWIAAGLAFRGCLACTDMLVFAIGNLSAPTALFAFFVQLDRQSKLS